MQDTISIPACFSPSPSLESTSNEHETALTRSGQSVFMSVYRTKVADQCRLISITWCKNLMLHGLSISVSGSEGNTQYSCKVELKPWYFWRKQGSKRLVIEDDYKNNKAIDIFWDLKNAKFHGETEPTSDYYVAVVCDQEVVLLLGDMKKEAYRRTRCRPSLIDPILVSKKEHIFGKKRFSTRAKFHEKGRSHEISIECKNNNNKGSKNNNNGGGDNNNNNNNNNNNGVVHHHQHHNNHHHQPELEIRFDGHLVIHVKHLQWKFRGNERIHLNKMRVEVYWDVHDWLFNNGLKHALFIFKPVLLSTSKSSSLSSSSPSPSPLSSSSPSTPLSSNTTGSSSAGSSSMLEGLNSVSNCSSSSSSSSSSEFCLVIYAWKVE